jgi:hypothetical protein
MKSLIFTLLEVNSQLLITLKYNKFHKNKNYQEGKNKFQ